MKKVIINFIALNVLVLFLGFAMTADTPTICDVTIDSPQGAVVETVGGRRVSLVGGGVQSGKIIMPSDFDATVIPLKIEPANEEVRVLSVRLVRHFVLERIWEVNVSASAFTHVDVSTACYHLSLRYGILALILELCLLVLAWLLSFFSRICTLPSPIDSVGIALAFSVVVVLVPPLQSVVANGVEIGVGVGETVAALAIPFGILVCVCLGLLLWTRRSAGVFFHLLLLGVAVYEYLELGILAADFPLLDGEIYFFLDIQRGLWDGGILFAIFGALFIAARRMPSLLPILSASVVLLSTASIIDARKKLPEQPKSELGLSFKPTSEVLTDCFHSTNRNVAVYVLDSVSIPFAVEVLQQDPVLVSKLEGFIAYTNNFGMAASTVLGVAGMTTGEYLRDPMQIAAYAQSCFGSNSFVSTYRDLGASVFFAPGSFRYGLSSVAGTNEMDKVNVRNHNPLHRRMKDQQQWNLFELSRFRLVPFLVKVLVYRMTIAGWDSCRTEYDERWCYPRIASAPVRDCKMTLQFWHTLGSHPPFNVNRDGVEDGFVRDGDLAIREKTWFALRQFANLMDELKRRGVYDRTFIVLTSDHGIDCRAKGSDGILGRARAILFVKPINAHGELSYSVEPTSHCKIRGLVESVATEDCNQADCTRLLRMPSRIFTRDVLGKLTDFHIDAKGMLVAKSERVDVHTSQISAIRLNHAYSLFSNNIEDAPPVRFTGSCYYGAADPRVIPADDQPGHATVMFRVPDAQTSYRLRFTIRPSGTAESLGKDGYSFVMEDLNAGTKSGLIEEMSPSLHNVETIVMSDKQGVVRVRLTCFDTLELRLLEVRGME